MIDLLRRGERDYLAQFGATEVYLSSAGKLGTGRNLARAGPLAAAWWVRDRFTAEQVLVAIGEKQPESVEAATAAIEAAAARLGVALSDRATVTQRAKTAVGRLDLKISTAQANGDLKFFNRAYQRIGLPASG